MHVTFVTLGMELLGVEYLSSYLQAHGHRVSLAHNPALFNDRFQLHIPALARLFERDDQIVEKILSLNPDLLAFSCLTNVFDWSVQIARRVRARRHVPTIFGGVHPSAVPAFVMEYPEVDFVCEGEGEVALLQLTDALASGGDVSAIPNIWSKAQGTVRPPPKVANFLGDLDALPFPDKELYAPYIPKRYVYRMMTARGCPYRCTFCFNNFFANLPSAGTTNREYLRRRSVDNCITELVRGKERFDYAYIEFHDDIFTMDKAWLQAFLPRLRDEIGVPWFCETHARFMDDELAQLMKDTGCISAKMGVQTLDTQEYRSKTLKRYEKEKDIIATFAAFRKASIQLDVDHIFGLPDESPDALERALAFYREHTPGRIGCFFLTYFPGIELTNRAHARGDISDAQLDDIKRGRMLWYHQVHALTPQGRERLRTHAAYMAAFHLLPSVPKLLRGLIQPRLLAKFPRLAGLSRWIMAAQMLVDRLFGAGDPEALLYLRLYLHHMLGAGRKLNRVAAPRGRPTLEAEVSTP